MISVQTYFVNDESVSDELCLDDEKKLDELVKNTKCNAVIISTEPLSHFKYTIWALKNNLHILLDKPITTEVNVSTDLIKAKKLYLDYKKIESKYREKLKNNNLVFILQAQRRFHSGFQYVKERLRDVYSKTQCPVTSLQSFHSDGQWRLPKEIAEINYHSYNQNYGKMSHSGYHSLDISLWLCDLKLNKDKKYKSASVYSKFSRPFDFLNQLNLNDYKLFFSNFDQVYDSHTLRENLKIEGEIDAFNSISLYNSKKALITHISSSMVHNGFSQRGWYIPNVQDLYKGNGRVRHESYIIEQGPFQSIVINSFQSHELLKDALSSEMGGESHFDVHVFRNSSLFPELERYSYYSIVDKNDSSISYSRGHNENARRNCIDEFFTSIKNNKTHNLQKSNFLDHELSTKVLSAIYESGASDFNNINNVIEVEV